MTDLNEEETRATEVREFSDMLENLVLSIRTNSKALNDGIDEVCETMKGTLAIFISEKDRWEAKFVEQDEKISKLDNELDELLEQHGGRQCK